MSVYFHFTGAPRATKGGRLYPLVRESRRGRSTKKRPENRSLSFIARGRLSRRGSGGFGGSGSRIRGSGAAAIEGAHRIDLLEEEVKAGLRLIGIVVVAAGVDGEELILRGGGHAEVILAALQLIVDPLLDIRLVGKVVVGLAGPPGVVFQGLGGLVFQGLIHGEDLPLGVDAKYGHIPGAAFHGGEIRQGGLIQGGVALGVGAIGLAQVHFLHVMQLMEHGLADPGIVGGDNDILGEDVVMGIYSAGLDLLFLFVMLGVVPVIPIHDALIDVGAGDGDPADAVAVFRLQGSDLIGIGGDVGLRRGLHRGRYGRGGSGGRRTGRGLDGHNFFRLSAGAANRQNSGKGQQNGDNFFLHCISS